MEYDLDMEVKLTLCFTCSFWSWCFVTAIDSLTKTMQRARRQYSPQRHMVCYHELSGLVKCKTFACSQQVDLRVMYGGSLFAGLCYCIQGEGSLEI